MQPVLAIDLGTTKPRTALGWEKEVNVFSNRYSERGLQLWVNRTDEEMESSLPRFQGFKQRLGDPEIMTKLTEVLSDLREDGEEHAGEGISRCVFCLPSLFPDKARSALGSAAQSAGFQAFRLVSEVQAQWLGLPDPPSAGPTLAYSLGAGLFSAEIIVFDHGNPRIAASVGSMKGAGLEFDQALLALILMRANVEFSISTHLPLLRRIRGMVEQAKVSLSRREEIRLDFPLHEWTGEGHNIELSLSRADLERVIRPLVSTSNRMISSELMKLNIEPKDLTQVLLSGGSTLIPLVVQEICSSFSTELRRVPDDAAVRGAAQWGAGLEDAEWTQIECMPPASAQVVAPHPVHLPPPAKGQWAAMYTPSLEQAESLWNEGRYPDSINAFNGMVGQAQEYLATLHQQYGTKLLASNNFAEAIHVLRIGYAYCFRSKDPMNPTDPHGARQICMLLERAFELHAAQLWKDEQYTVAFNVAREGLGCCPKAPRLTQLFSQMREQIKSSRVPPPRKSKRR